MQRTHWACQSENFKINLRIVYVRVMYQVYVDAYIWMTGHKICLVQHMTNNLIYLTYRGMHIDLAYIYITVYLTERWHVCAVPDRKVTGVRCAWQRGDMYALCLTERWHVCTVPDKKVTCMRCTWLKGDMHVLCLTERWHACAVPDRKVTCMRCIWQKGDMYALYMTERWHVCAVSDRKVTCMRCTWQKSGCMNLNATQCTRRKGGMYLACINDIPDNRRSAYICRHYTKERACVWPNIQQFILQRGARMGPNIQQFAW